MYVEAELDNSMKRFKNYKDSITIRKSLQDKSYKYMINGKDINSASYYSFIECLGMSRTTSMNIVPQNQIKKIAMMSEEQLYELLKEIIGTKQYDEKKKESIIILDKT